jgi:Rap1a immunity proteins
MNTIITRTVGAALLGVGLAANMPHRAAAAGPLASADNMLLACEQFERIAHIDNDGGVSVLLEASLKSVTGTDSLICWGFLGAMHQVSYWKNHDTPLLGVCLPKESTLIQLARVFTAFARSHPEQLHEQAAAVVLRAFQSAFPCKP